MWPQLAQAIITVGLHNQGFLRGIAQTQLRMLAFTSVMQSQANQIGNSLRAALWVGGAGGVAGGATGFALYASSWAEQAEKSLEHFLGSARAARELMGEIEEFAARTQFELPGAADAARKLLNVGIAAKEVIPTLQTLADAAASTGKGQEGFNRIVYAISQIRGSGTLKATEMRQLTEALIPAWEILADKMGKSIPEVMKMVTNRQVESAEAIRLILEGMNDRYAGMTEKMLNTLGGKWGRFKDELFILFKDLGDVLNPWMSKFLDVLTNITMNLQEHVQNWGEHSRYFAENWRDSLDYWTLGFQEAFAKIAAGIEYFTFVWSDLVKYIVDTFKNAFDYLTDFVRTFFENLATWGLEWVLQFKRSIGAAIDDIRHGRVPNPRFEEFDPKTKEFPEFQAATLPRTLQGMLAAIDAAFEGRETALAKKLEEAWNKIINPEGIPLEDVKGREIPKGLEDERDMKRRGPEFLGLEELWKKRQLSVLEDPVVKAIGKANDNQVAALNRIGGKLDNIEENTREMGVQIA